MLTEELAAAREAAAAAAQIIAPLYRQNLRVQMKADATPVTEADVRAEEVIRHSLHQRFPSYGFYGEESGRHAAEAENVWLVDPLDGTKSFVRECPFFSTQIALMRAGELVLGVSSAPIYGEVAWAARGRGAFLNGEPIRVSQISQLGGSVLSTGNIRSLAGDARWLQLGRLIRQVSRVRGYGDFLHYHLLARGSLELVIESDVHILDVAALSVIVHEAGGRCTDLQGSPLGLNTTSILASNGVLHTQILQQLAP
ncbi:MAG: inositol-phosphate phosphatase [Sinobacteraceae bacterium]|nr:inositol-phosphate phosphatase [Nevskiaceae bacterium]